LLNEKSLGNDLPPTNGSGVADVLFNENVLFGYLNEKSLGNDLPPTNGSGVAEDKIRKINKKRF